MVLLTSLLCFAGAGCLVDSVDKEDNTALHIASRYGHELLINTLLKHGSDPWKYVLCSGCAIYHKIAFVLHFLCFGASYILHSIDDAGAYERTERLLCVVDEVVSA